MVKKKTKFIVKCPYCKKNIIGFSEYHAKKNLLIHKKLSERCKYIRKHILKK